MTREQFRPVDHPNDHFLLTTVVGSYPKPRWLHRAQELVEDDAASFNAADFAAAKDDAARLITEDHEHAALDVVTDGEMRREEMVEYFAERIDGFEFNGPVKVWGHNYFDKPSVVGEVSYAEEWLVSEYEFTAGVASSPVKVPITGPYTIANWSFNEVYEDDETLTRELAGLVAEEVEALVDAGVRYIQIDEPALATTPDDHAIVGDALDRIVADLPADVRLGLHVCYGDYSRIYPEVLEDPVDELDLELCNGDYEQLDVFRNPPFAKDIGFGVVDVHDSTVESVAEIKRNIRRGLEIVPPEQLTISPDCGLKLLDREVAQQKLEHMVTAARETERELDVGELEPASPAPADD